MNFLLLSFFVLVFTLLGAFGSLYLKKGSVKTNKKIMSFFNKEIMLGVFFYLLSTIFYLYLLSLLDLSLLYPLSSLSYVWVLLLSKHLLKEKITKNRVFGVLLIILGIIVIR